MTFNLSDSIWISRIWQLTVWLGIAAQLFLTGRCRVSSLHHGNYHCHYFQPRCAAYFEIELSMQLASKYIWNIHIIFHLIIRASKVMSQQSKALRKLNIVIIGMGVFLMVISTCGWVDTNTSCKGSAWLHIWGYRVAQILWIRHQGPAVDAVGHLSCITRVKQGEKTETLTTRFEFSLFQFWCTRITVLFWEKVSLTSISI